MRVMHNFWLDLSLEVESELDRAIAGLKAKRQFAPTLRNGLRLIISLRETETRLRNNEQPAFNALSLLEVMFAKVVQFIASRQHSVELENLRQEMEDLRQRLDMASTMPAPVKPRVPAPEPELKVKKTSKPVDVAANFFKSMGGFQKPT